LGEAFCRRREGFDHEVFCAWASGRIGSMKPARKAATRPLPQNSADALAVWPAPTFTRSARRPYSG
jgi:hypothetical protein